MQYKFLKISQILKFYTFYFLEMFLICRIHLTIKMKFKIKKKRKNFFPIKTCLLLISEVKGLQVHR